MCASTVMTSDEFAFSGKIQGYRHLDTRYIPFIGQHENAKGSLYCFLGGSRWIGISSLHANATGSRRALPANGVFGSIQIWPAACKYKVFLF
jgi:hypothetical protein